MSSNSPQFTVQQMVDALVECKGLVYLAARKLGCHPRTVLRYKAKHKAVRDACETERGEIVDVAEVSLYKAVKAGKGWAVCFILKTLGKDRGYVQRVEVENDERPKSRYKPKQEPHQPRP